MALVSLQRGQTHSGVNYWNDVWVNDNEIVTQVNGNLDNSNIAAAASIAHSKLANTDAGKLLIANASGVITGTAMSGDVTISSTGVSTIGNDKVTADQLKDSVATDGDRAVTTNHIRNSAVTTAKVADDAVNSAKLDLYTDYTGPSSVTCSWGTPGTISLSSIPAGVYQVIAGSPRFSSVAQWSLWFSNTGTMSVSGPTSANKSEGAVCNTTGNGPSVNIVAIVTVTATGNLTLNIEPSVGSGATAYDTFVSLYGVKS